MKKIFLLFVLSVTFGNAQKLKTSLEELKLKGNVKSVLFTEYSVIEKFGKVSKGETTYADKSYFDMNGNIVEEIIYGQDGDPFQNKTYEYDSKGNVIKYTVHNLRIKSKTTNGKKRLSDRSKFTMNFYYKYDEKGYLIEDNYIKNRIGEYIEGKNVYKYDSARNIVLKYLYKDELCHLLKKIKYDMNGNTIQYVESGCVTEVNLQ